MPSSEPSDTLFLLHGLGGSARTWHHVAQGLPSEIRCVALDLPGFGDAASVEAYGVAAMADAVATTIAAAAPRRWWIAGHSMGAKITLAVARRAEDGVSDLAGLAGLILVAGSPPAPEPMDEAQRAEMIAWIGGDAQTRRRGAAAFIADNVGAPLDPGLAEAAAADVLRADPTAWRAWLAEGTREDWRGAIDRLATPALVFSGTKDTDLGPEAQERLMRPHLSRSRHVMLDGASHLLPLERPLDVSHHLRAFIEAGS